MKALDALFQPRSIALIGASEKPGKLGTVVLRNLQLGGFEPIYPVNPSHKQISGLTVYPSVAELPDGPIDTAIVVTPAATIPKIIDECGARGIRAAIVLSAGFREAGKAGKALEDEVLQRAAHHGVRILGPNCLGVMRTSIGFNATFSEAPALPGSVALVSQSGALCTAILDWAHQRNIGFSSVISTGIGADVDFGEILDYLVRDPATDSIMMYIEGIHDARVFMSALRAAARVKPVVVMKAGRHAEGSRAAASHTGALVGADDVFDAALRRAGVLRVHNFSDFFAAAGTLDTGVRAQGRRLAIITNAGGPGVMAADHVTDRGLQLAGLAKATLKTLDKGLPDSWSRGNPVDILGDADEVRYALAVQACLDDPGVDALLVILTPQALTDPLDVARQLAVVVAAGKKPIFACWMGGESVLASRRLFNERNIPVHATPESSVDAFAALASYATNQAQLLQVPEPAGHQPATDLDTARAMLREAVKQGHDWLDAAESKQLLAAFGIPVVPSRAAHSLEQAVALADEIGYPLAMKILSPDITHKTDVGGVTLGLSNAKAVSDEFQAMHERVARLRPEAQLDGVLLEAMYEDPAGRELMVGVLRDEVFGPVISFGMGGTLVEVIQDRAVALPPLNRFLVKDLVARTRASKLLGPLRGKPPVDLQALEDLLLRVSEMVCELGGLVEMDLNPVVAGPDGVRVVDARIRARAVEASARPYAHMAIHPYPTALAQHLELADGARVLLRPIRPEDAQMEQAFVRGLSEQSKYLRFMYAARELSPSQLSRFTQIDYDREMALVALDLAAKGDVQIGVARYVTLADEESCEFAVVVDDAWQGRGLAHSLMSALIAAARKRQLCFMLGTTLAENHRMLDLARRLGFSVSVDPEERDLRRMKLEL